MTPLNYFDNIMMTHSNKEQENDVRTENGAQDEFFLAADAVDSSR
jgi:hypothetical protein